MLGPTCAACHQILMLLLTCLWNASPSVCEETRQDLPPQLPPRCTGFAVPWELSSTEAPSPRAPRGTHSIPHTSPARSAPGLGGGGRRRIRHGSCPPSPQPAGGDNTHINYPDPRWRGARPRMQVGEAAWAAEGGEVISPSKPGSRTRPKRLLCWAIWQLPLCCPPLGLEGLRGLPAPGCWPQGLSSPLSFRTCTPFSPWGALSGGCLGGDVASQLLTVCHQVNNPFFFNCAVLPQRSCPEGRSNVQ